MSRSMKDSGVAWIGEIPSDWEVSINKTVLQNVSVRNHPDAEVLSLYRDWGIVPKNSRDDNHNVTSEKTEQYKFVESGDLVINKMKAWQGSLAVSEYEGIVSPAYYVCKFKNDMMDKNYIHHLLRSCIYAQQFERLSTGMRVGQWDLSIDDFLTSPLLVPPKDEQGRIANEINNKCNQVDTLIANQQKQIEKLKQYKQSLITEVVTKGLNPNVEMIETEFGENQPLHWEYKRLKYETEINKSTSIPNDIEVISYSPMECVRSDAFTPKTISTEKLPTGLSSFKEGDILLAKITPCFENGNVAIAKDLINGYGVGSSELIPFAPKKIFDRFLMYLFQSNRFVENGKSTIRGIGGLRRITMDFVYGYSFYAPDIDEQKQIVSYLDSKCSKIEDLIIVKQQKIEKLNQYKKFVIYEYVTGKKEA